MIGHIKGQTVYVEGDRWIVSAGGVGYELLVCQGASKFGALGVGAEVELFVHTNVREGAIELFGFSSIWERKVFLSLLDVSGVGPKTAIGILGGIGAEDLLSGLARGDRALMSSISGVGKKTAERLILELGDKARKLLAERPKIFATESTKRFDKSEIPPQGASASPVPVGVNAVELTDLWNEAIAALAQLGYKEAEALEVVKFASSQVFERGLPVTIESLVRVALQSFAGKRNKGARNST